MKNTRGFTLIEVLIAVAIFSIGILGVAKMQLWNVKNTTTGNTTTMATMLGRGQIEELKGVDNVTALDTPEPCEDDIDADGNAGGIFTRCWIRGPGPTGSTRRIDVTVSWDRWGQNRSIVLTTITRGNGT